MNSVVFINRSFNGFREGEECCICHVNKKTEVVYHNNTQGVMHVFHRDCLEPWLSLRSCCPLCEAPASIEPRHASSALLSAVIATGSFVSISVIGGIAMGALAGAGVLLCAHSLGQRNFLE